MTIEGQRPQALHEYDHDKLRAWRRVLDSDGSNRVNWYEFQLGCKKATARVERGVSRSVEDAVFPLQAQ